MKIAAQMYSIRETAQKGYENALKQVAAIGFKSVELVEFCGYGEFNGKPAELKKCLDDLGLEATGVHIGFESIFNPESRKKMIDFYGTLNARYMICPQEGAFMDPEQNARLAEDCNKAAEYLKQFNMFCGYHNHKDEFQIDPNTGKSYWETFADRTSADVVLEQDCGWTVMAQQDPAEMIRKYPGRSNVLHFKPSVLPTEEAEKLSVIGQDSVDWAAVIKAAEEAGNTEYAVIEQEWYLPGKTDMESLAASFEGLKALMKK